jgi:hypothetical protein
MDLTPYVDQLRRDLTNAANAAGPEVVAAAERIAAALDPSARIVLLDALASAADEVTAALQGEVVELRLRGREPQLVVQGLHQHAPEPPLPPPPASAPGPAAEDEGMARVSLRLPESLKARAEEAAAREGVSLNNWLVRIVSTAVDPQRGRGPVRTGNRLTGWAKA